MLQISTGKFYETTDQEKLYTTLHRGVFYTNYGFLRDRIITCVGDLLSAAKYEDVQVVVGEVTERLPKPDRDPMPGDICSAGGGFTMLQDFSALISFGMNITCTLDHNLARRLITVRHPPLGIYAIPHAYVSRIFDASIPYQEKDFVVLNSFITDLINLERKSYVGVMRAVRRYVTAMHRLADDLDLAYALLVASIESLAQEFDEFAPIWDDLAPEKRCPIEEALKNATIDIRDNVHQAILQSEHVALKRRFCEFIRHYLQPEFFRESAKNQSNPAGRTEINIGLKNAYDIRSEYIHKLKALPKNLVQIPSLSDFLMIDSRPVLTFNGLARIARHVILKFTQQALKVEKEVFDYTSEYPGIVRMSLAPQYWIGNPEGYSEDTSRMVLNGFLSQISNCIMNPEEKVTDLRPVMEKIKMLVPSLAKLKQKMPMLTLYVIFSYYLPENEREQALLFLKPYWDLFDQPTIDSFVAHLLVDLFVAGEKRPEWSLETSDKLLNNYMTQRYHKKGLNAGSLFGAAMILWVAEMYRLSGNKVRVRELITFAVEEFPQQKSLYDFEKKLSDDAIPEINYKHILLSHHAESKVNPAYNP